MKLDRAWAALALCLLFTVPAFAQTPVPADLDDWVARSMRTFDVPGLSLAIVKDGKVLAAKGYGVRKLGEATPVDQDTLFGIGSNTKAFTTACLAMLVDEGKIAWDGPVRQYLPDFQMYDPYVSHEMTVRDLLTHRSGMGLGQGDLLFYPPTTYTRAEIIHKLRYMKPASSFRSRFAYDNLLYMAAGQVIPAVTGTSWDDFVRQRIFLPLGMTNSNVSIDSFKSGDNIAYPHSSMDGKLQVIPFVNLDNAGAGGFHQLLCRGYGQVGAAAAQPRQAARPRGTPVQRKTVARNVVIADDPADFRAAAIAGGPQGELQQLCIGLECAGLSWAQAGCPHRRVAGIRFTRDAGAGAESRRGDSDQRGGGRRI